MELQRFVDGRPEYYITDNAVSAATSSSTRLYPGGALGFALTGAGVSVAEWDGGKVRTTHQEFGNRVTQMDNTTSQMDHATHVAGTMVASGVKAEAKGMAYQASLQAHDWNNDLGEMTARAAEGIQVSNHSYGSAVGWMYNYRGDGRWAWFGVPGDSPAEDRNFGRYEERAREWDQLVYNAPYYIPVKSAGNDRGEGPTTQPISHWEFDNNVWALTSTFRENDGGSMGYDCVTSYGNAKNILTIGAVEDVPGGYGAPSDVRMSSFSGWGPTDDGRIKPDIVANGINLYSCLKTSNSAYASYSGTSMSAPSVTGSIALLLQHQKNIHGNARLRASSIKALLLHTADEAGPAQGPDYQHGWGLLNTASAAKLMTANAQASSSVLIRERELNENQTIDIPIYSPGRGPLKVTICWTDPAGSVQAAKVDPTTRVLINDLDVSVIDPSSGQHLPWILNPANPDAPAVRGNNVVDNVEQVFIQAPDEGTYIVRITHKGTLQSDGQFVSIIASVSNEVSLLSPPNNLVNSSVTPALQWNTARGAQSYEVQVDETADFTSPVVNATGIAQTWYDTPALKKQSRYYWKVRARDAQGASEWSDVWTFVTGGNIAQGGHALEFDGADDHAVRTNVSGLGGIEQNDVITIEAWVFVHGWVNGAFAIADKHNPATGTGWSLRLRSGGAIEFSPSTTLSCGAGVPQNTWAHIAVTWSKQSGKVRYYINGAKRCESDHSGDIQSTGGGPLYIGYSPSGTPAYGDGIIDELRIWNTVRTETDINAGMFTSYSASEPGLVAQWGFDEARGLTTAAQPGSISSDLVQGPAWVVSSVPMTKPPAPVPIYPPHNSANIPISATALWQPATSALRYRVQLSRESNFSNLIMDVRDLTAISQAFPVMLPETGYYWRGNSTNALGTSDWTSAQYFVTAVAPPNAPKLVVPKNGAKDQLLTLTLLWEAPPRAITYHVQVSTDSLFKGGFLIDRTDIIIPSVDVPDLGNRQRCYWRVRAVNFGGSSPWSEQWTFVTIPAEPEAPILILPTANEKGVAVNPQFFWEAAEGAVDYTMQLSIDSTFTSTIINAAGIPFTQYAAANLEQGVWHFWRVRASNSAGAGEWSEIRRFLTLRPLPDAVQLIVPARDAVNIELRPEFTWQPLSAADSYTLQVSETDQFSAALLNISGIAGGVYKVTLDLPSEQLFYWRARAANERGEGPWSDVWSFTTAKITLAVPELRLPPNVSTQAPEAVDFAWTQVDGADAYRLEIGQDTLAAAVQDVTAASTTLLSLNEEATHFWRVSAKRGVEEGPWSPWWSFSTTLRLPDAVTLLSPPDDSSMQSDTVRFLWTASQPQVTTYWLEYAFDNGFLGQRFIDSTLTMTGLTIPISALASPCYWRVRARNSAGWGPFSITGNFNPLILGATGQPAISAAIVFGHSWPNPAATHSSMSLILPQRTHATIEVRDVLGRIAGVIHDAPLDAGTHTISLELGSLPPGRYVLVLRAAGAVALRNLNIVR